MDLNLPVEIKLIMELGKDLITLKDLASDQDSSEGKPACIGLLYNLIVRLILQR